MTMILRAAMLMATFVAGAICGPAWGQTSADATIELKDDGSVAVSGLNRPAAGMTLPEDCRAEADNAATVTCMAERFLGMLSEEQKNQVLLPMTSENATSWSNLPCGSSCRVGIELADLDEDQRQAALGVILAASGTDADSGFDELTQVLMADDILTLAQDAGIASGPGGGPPPDDMKMPDGAEAPEGGGDMGPPPDGGLAYSSNAYFIAFLGEPSTTSTWQLQFGGHHLAILHTFAAGKEIAATPNFIGIEPKVWTQDGTTYAPLTDDRDTMVDMLSSLSAEQMAKAKLSQAFSDVLLGPGKDGQFPETKAGLPAGDLTGEQKALVLDAMRSWVADTSATSAASIMTQYEAELDDTYIAFSGHATLDNHADYVRIDGPGVWIEFVCQNGVIFGDQIHYHTIWRDHVNDYGAIYDF
ncbi:DUF3500 domain-containing protein [Consotaella aegiceratis]|uniref:DUF3500 domain-containing protein n=1 Tax=Consotaella aegiceratis TaxID=3097961 RepID=UPI002F3FBDEC